MEELQILMNETKGKKMDSMEALEFFKKINEALGKVITKMEMTAFQFAVFVAAFSKLSDAMLDALEPEERMMCELFRQMVHNGFIKKDVTK